MKKIPPNQRKSFYRFLQTQLGGQIPPELLPRRLRVLGHVAILWLNPEIIHFKELIGQTVLEYNPKIKTVLHRTAAISGPYRQPAVELIAGSTNTETVFKENKVIFHIDPMKVMFSLGNKAERVRMSKLGSDEFVVDMFAGIGHLSMPMAVHAKPKVIHAIEWNPDAFHYLTMNIQANKVLKLFKPHFGDTREIAPIISQGQADRVIMGLIQGTTRYLEQGIQCLRPGGVLHIHEIGPRGDMATELLSTLKKKATAMNRTVNLVTTRTIKTYNPRYDHFVLDVQISDA
ncbi:MAG: class I SAM-dependent methyltransferase family protein [Candidatus Thorarchaeota archaeon]